MVDGTTKFRLATAGSLLCVAALAWMYRMHEGDAASHALPAPPAAKAPVAVPTPASLGDEPEHRTGHAEEDEQARMSQST